MCTTTFGIHPAQFSTDWAARPRHGSSAAIVATFPIRAVCTASVGDPMAQFLQHCPKDDQIAMTGAMDGDHGPLPPHDSPILARIWICPMERDNQQHARVAKPAGVTSARDEPCLQEFVKPVASPLAAINRSGGPQ
jgi:hypothetical protein